jgi:hypothetical protein
VAELTDTSELAFTELRQVRTHRIRDKGGRYRWYNDHVLPDRLGSGVVTVRLHATDKDRGRRFNRTENVRPIAHTDPDFPHPLRQTQDQNESLRRRNLGR